MMGEGGGGGGAEAREAVKISNVIQSSLTFPSDMFGAFYEKGNDGKVGGERSVCEKNPGWESRCERIEMSPVQTSVERRAFERAAAGCGGRLRNENPRGAS